MTLADTNVVADLITPDPDWQTWSIEALHQCRNSGEVSVNEIVFAELSARLSSENEVRSILSDLGLAFEWIPTEALFVSGQTYRRYRAAGGLRPSVLPDFFYRRSCAGDGTACLDAGPAALSDIFPDVQLITPDA
jgi:predicted nucleic acid-binding protein